MPTPARIRVLIVDDHALVRDGIRRLIDHQDGMEVIGDAGDGAEGLRLAVQLAPAVALVDVSMPRCDGIVATTNMAERCPCVKVVAFSRQRTTDVVRAMLGAGAAAYVLKQSASMVLIEAIRAVAAGGTYVDGALRFDR
jgi:DNA-binding NarL/FixJ family response regulator